MRPYLSFLQVIFLFIQNQQSILLTILPIDCCVLAVLHLLNADIHWYDCCFFSWRAVWSPRPDLPLEMVHLLLLVDRMVSLSFNDNMEGLAFVSCVILLVLNMHFVDGKLSATCKEIHRRSWRISFLSNDLHGFFWWGGIYIHNSVLFSFYCFVTWLWMLM